MRLRIGIPRNELRKRIDIPKGELKKSKELTKLKRQQYNYNSKQGLHRSLKDKAHRWLKLFGCVDIQYEYKLQLKKEYIITKNQSMFSRKKIKVIVFDVVGFIDNKLIIIECGCIHPKNRVLTINKLLKDKTIEELYILPFGKDVPEIYSEDDIHCMSCGNKLN